MIRLVNVARAAGVSMEGRGRGEEAAKGKARAAESGEFVYLPRNSVRTGGGRGTLQSLQIVDYLAFKTEWLRRRVGIDPKSLMMIEAVSDSMAPTIDEGDLVVVDLRDPRFRHDGGYVLRASGGLPIKRMQRRRDGKLIIHNDNSAHEPAVVAADSVNVVGHVIWIGGKL